ncbi:16S rRNA (adenine(1518)-N(6)/adenine(1519)-N(6))-dimethyltransferase RsmA [Bifidobacterium crudilactis]|jgi:16S rRNA (adenine1518-N6/adenine1519-N6)-dimethyltransferase|uniref:16S rRNA (adenine(1518)-N(6)/adenine(1519)-N(6))- dimethyltransferase RsmA n=1 Tax=Bifidobacterium crudilactis TaxID=327277 RepID=UPI002352EA9E|nr:16S rRNA (adenine(1518)-N(6)/adenine(1519)-N(6))-dimethyltransferase RsmA [Bifidobacterium crudilactis]MCI1218604.1 16S rRNA (adenine(1518)-N(6)/adenine(1519)-N(6))-dimethyltransferase RsmA [Bifidobacterium crudilactis]MCI1637894.1 16S rRNA (adenine(1518)-N(6)/adenine(1519)-N(6))-dimethyltransferase RsmA [Bifidobacterium crudilactis]
MTETSIPAAHATTKATPAEETHSNLLGAADIRRIAAEAGISPTKKLGQNFVIDPGTVRKIVRESGIGSDDLVLEVGPGLGSLTLGILEVGAHLTAVEIDPPLAARLPSTVSEYNRDGANRLNIVNQDALLLQDTNLPAEYGTTDFTLVANLPYNVATPILLTLLERFPHLTRFLVMVQKEVADRLVASPGTKIYGTPSAKLAWYGTAKRAGTIGRNVFWPAPNVDSALVLFTRDKAEARDINSRASVFDLIDAAFQQRRKTLHAALRQRVGDQAYALSGIDPTRRGETLGIDEFMRLNAAAERAGE